MRPILLFLTLLCVPELCNSQVTANIKTIYLDSLWQKTTQGKHQYYRIINGYYSEKQDTYQIRDYYKSGVLEKEGLSKTKEGDSWEGEFIYYYENGNKKSICNYSKGRQNGKDFEWYENGNKKLEGQYIEEEKKRTTQHKINQFWDVNGNQKVVDGNGIFEDKKENEYDEKGEIKNGFKEGVWEGTFYKLKYNYKEIYKDGKFVSGISINSTDGQKYSYTELEIKPDPKDGIMDFYKFISKNFKTPSTPKGLHGKIYVTFIVDKEGKIVEPKILRDLGYGTGEEAIRVVTAYNGFLPGEQRGRKVRCKYSLPISIQSSN